MPFGAPATFQRLMDTAIRELEGYTAVYLDDIIIFSKTWEEHLKNVKEQLLHCNSLFEADSRENGVSLNN